ncbi:hypothetical protein FKL19_18760 [Raoultella ornithinolytica]|nr:hypothetical protein [Raoultella ornithinolytica]OWP45295.1 hypothetical protein CEG93_05425 [Raoultella ornithinolytica]
MIACTFMRLCRPGLPSLLPQDSQYSQPDDCNFFTIAQQLRFVQVPGYSNTTFSASTVRTGA